MDDRIGEFFTLVAEACDHANRATLAVEIHCLDDSTHTGVPEPAIAEERDAGEADDSGWSKALRVGDETIDLEKVVSFAVSRP